MPPCFPIEECSCLIVSSSVADLQSHGRHLSCKIPAVVAVYDVRHSRAALIRKSFPAFPRESIPTNTFPLSAMAGAPMSMKRNPICGRHAAGQGISGRASCGYFQDCRRRAMALARTTLAHGRHHTRAHRHRLSRLAVAQFSGNPPRSQTGGHQLTRMFGSTRRTCAAKCSARTS